ncbi:MAG: GDP-mannose 4,6-dehydratase [Nitrospiraceae bacterium]|nr:GDP-mannose 4,6-dehydratase [Nitrospiraceae bacterium]
MKSILVTGGAGFIGSNFIQHIFRKYQDYRLVVLDALTYAGNIENIPPEIRNSDRFEFWYGNLNNLDLVNDLVERSAFVVHFAAETHVARSLYLNRVFFVTDVLGTQSIANAVLKHSDTVERFIHISTSEVYGTALRDPMDEEHPLNPTTPYAAAKAGADRLVSSYVESYDIPGVIIRPFNNYGPRQHLEKVIPRFITSAILGEPLTIHGDGSAARDWLFVEDTAEAVDRALHAPLERVKGEVFNIGTGVSISVLEIARRISSAFGLDDSHLTFMDERFGQVQNHISSTGKAEKTLGFRAAVGFEEGLERTIQWYKDNVSYWEKQVSMRKVPVKNKAGEIVWY